MVDVTAAFHQHFCRSGVRKNNIGILSEAKPRVFPYSLFERQSQTRQLVWKVTCFSEEYNIAMTYRKQIVPVSLDYSSLLRQVPQI